MSNDATENNITWMIVLLFIVSSLLVSIITSAVVVKDKFKEYSTEYNQKIENLQTQIDSLNVVINENKELPVFEVVIKNEVKETKKTINPRLKDTIVKPIIIQK